MLLLNINMCDVSALHFQDRKAASLAEAKKQAVLLNAANKQEVLELHFV